MNRFHRLYCRSAHWRHTLEQRLLPWALGHVDLGPEVLEVGPGPGCVTDLLHERATHWTALEIDPELAARLDTRMHGSNVRVMLGDATAMTFPDEHFSGAVSFTMLHHVPSPTLQDGLLREVHRVLRPGGVFVGTDSRSSLFFEWLHLWDTLVPVDPATFGERLERAGFRDVAVDASPRTMRFRAFR